jgi:polygalacturonase
MSGGVRRVLVHDCLFDGTLYGIRLKSARGRGGVVEDVWAGGIAMRNILRAAVFMNTFYKAWAVTGEGKAPVFRNIHVRDVQCDGALAAAELTGLEEQPLENITLEGVTISARTGLTATNVDGLTLSDVNIKAASGPPFQMTNCRNLRKRP